MSESSGSQSGMRFDNHIAMVMEKGIINMDQYLVEYVNYLKTTDYPNIISSVFNIVKEAHRKKLVLLDLKGSNIMLFDIGRGMNVWKGIDLDGSLLVGKLLDESSFMATVPFMAPELLAVDSHQPLTAMNRAVICLLRCGSGSRPIIPQNHELMYHNYHIIHFVSPMKMIPPVPYLQRIDTIVKVTAGDWSSFPSRGVVVVVVI